MTHCCNLNAVRHSSCLVINPITVSNFTDIFNCTPTDLALDAIELLFFSFFFWGGRGVGTGAILFVAWSTGVQLMTFYCFRFLVVLFDGVAQKKLYLPSPRLCFFLYSIKP